MLEEINCDLFLQGSNDKVGGLGLLQEIFGNAVTGIFFSRAHGAAARPPLAMPNSLSALCKVLDHDTSERREGRRLPRLQVGFRNQVPRRFLLRGISGHVSEGERERN